MIPGRTPSAARLLVLALAALCAVAAAARTPDPASADRTDPRVAWLREHAVELATIDPADPADGANGRFSDLEPLKTTLGDVRMVLLGEATRGDGSTLLAKARLVRFLHEEMGFDVLVLDCGFYQCGRGWQEARAAETPEAAKRALVDALGPMRLYSEATQFQPLLDEVVARRAGEHPLVVAGAGPEVAGAGAEMLGELRALLRSRGTEPDEIPGFAEVAAVVGALDRGSFTAGERPIPPVEVRERFAATLREIGRRLEGRSTPDATVKAAFFRQVLDNLVVEARMTWELGVYRPGQGVPPAVTTLVNRQTADNLLWLARQRYPGHKIVVSARTVFLARHLSRLETGDLAARARFDRFTTVGHLLEDALGDRAYIVGFTAFEGRTGTPFNAPHALLEPTAGSFEDLMGRTGLQAAFVDLRGLHRQGRGARWLTRPLIARPLSFKELRGSWPRHLDAFLFLRTMEPSHLAAAVTP